MFDLRTAARRAPVDHTVLDVIAERWSPRSIDPDRPVDRSALMRLLEAARWTPSSGNAQPWRYLVFDDTVPAELAKARACLNRGNRWAHAAPVLLLSCVATNWPDSDEPNPMALHDVGAASLALALQATEEGLATHTMAGFDRRAAAEEFALAPGVEPATMIAIGHPGDPEDAAEEIRARDARPRKRRPLGQTAFVGGFDGPGVTG